MIVCVGLATLDTILRVPRHPGPDERVVADECVIAGGGPAATAAVAISHMKFDVAFVGAVGDDAAGEEIRKGLEEEGVDVSGLEVVPGARSPQSTILVHPDGARTIVHVPGTAPLTPRDLPAAEWVHADHHGYAAVTGRGHRLSVDAGNPIEGLDLSEVDLFVPTESSLVHLSAEQRTSEGQTKDVLKTVVSQQQVDTAARDALAAGAGLVVVTRGAAGSAAYTREGEIIVAPAHPVDAVSTLGAGDVFHGALLAQLAKGLDLRDALAEANRIAAESCRALDGRSAIPRA